MFVKYKILPDTKLNLEKLFKTFKISPKRQKLTAFSQTVLRSKNDSQTKFESTWQEAFIDLNRFGKTVLSKFWVFQEQGTS